MYRELNKLKDETNLPEKNSRYTSLHCVTRSDDTETVVKFKRVLEMMKENFLFFSQPIDNYATFE